MELLKYFTFYINNEILKKKVDYTSLYKLISFEFTQKHNTIYTLYPIFDQNNNNIVSFVSCVHSYACGGTIRNEMDVLRLVG